ncbi:MAG TPA: hypothetical protein PLO89_10700, partial [Spirochaetota bacterium]|nr:hypothetical protein [Spirochaetota bacterium]
CKVFDFTRSDKADSKRVELNRYSAYRQCVALGILHQGRGGDDTFTGVELLDTFSYLDYYVRYFKIIPREGELEFQKTDYDDLPEWRKILYKELDEQRKREKELKYNFHKIKKLKNDENKEKKGDDKIREKFIDDASDDSL